MPLLKTPLCWDDGHIIPPTAPNLRVELDMAALKQNPKGGSQLHLEMGQSLNDPGRDGPSASSYKVFMPAMLIQRRWQSPVKTAPRQKI